MRLITIEEHYRSKPMMDAALQEAGIRTPEPGGEMARRLANLGKSVVAFRREENAEVPPAKRFGFVQTYDKKPRRRLWELMKSQGLQENQEVVFMSDGGENVRRMQALDRLVNLVMELSLLPTRSAAAEKVGAGVAEFETYIRNNREYIPNFG